MMQARACLQSVVRTTDITLEHTPKLEPNVKALLLANKEEAERVLKLFDVE